MSLKFKASGGTLQTNISSNRTKYTRTSTDGGNTWGNWVASSPEGVSDYTETVSGDVSENGDDEVIEIDLSKVDPRTKSILIAVNIYSPGGSNFGQVKNPVVSIYKDNSDISEISYDLLEDYSRFTSIFAVEIYNHNGDWKIGALGVGKENWEDELTKLGIL